MRLGPSDKRGKYDGHRKHGLSGIEWIADVGGRVRND